MCVYVCSLQGCAQITSIRLEFYKFSLILWVFAQVRNLQVFPSYGWELLGAGLLTLLILQTKPRIYLLPDEQVGEASPWSLGLCC